MKKYRTHVCGELNTLHIGQQVKLAGWVYRKRDHGSLLFVDLRDHYGIIQIVFNDTNIVMRDEVRKIRFESVITINGTVVARSSRNINKNISTGKVEVVVDNYVVESLADELPMQVSDESDISEEIRLRYRFLDLRREKLHQNIIMRSQVIQEIRNQMLIRGFTEFQTPILTASSPEGARDFLVPSRLHPGKFYALPQAPQQFKQLLMIAGFDKYFQIAPCFRDEDARTDRSPGEFYQLDIEMAFVTQEDIFNIMDEILYNIFKKFSNYAINDIPFPRITYDSAMLKYGTDKPDLRNPIEMCDVTDIFKDSNFAVFKDRINQGAFVRAIPAPGGANKAGRLCNKASEYAKQQGTHSLAYASFVDSQIKGSITKFFSEELLQQIADTVGAKIGDAVLFMCDYPDQLNTISAKIRDLLGEELNLLQPNCYQFCWITDFPFYQLHQDTGKVKFSHNPFSMPQGGMETLNAANTTEDLLKIKAYQYDIVCNGIELSSGAIRNHNVDLMYKAFEIAGYSQEEVDKKFGAMIKAFKYGAPPHGGIAPGIDRILMLLTNSVNIREVIAFPMNQQAKDLLMDAPSEVEDTQLQELQLKVISQTFLNKLF